MPEPEAIPHIPTLAYAFTLFFIGLICLGVDIYTDTKGKRFSLLPWQTGWVEYGIFFLYTLFAILLVQVFVVSGQKFVGEDTIPEVWNIVWLGLSMHVSIILALVVSLRYFPTVFNLSFNIDDGMGKVSLLQAPFYFFAGIPLVAVANVLWMLWINKLNQWGIAVETDPQYMIQLINETDDTLALALLFIIAVILAPISEELFFRGCMYRFLKGKLRPLIAMGITSLLFALLHQNVASFLPLLLLGMLLNRCYEKTGKIYLCMIFHGLFNLNTMISLLFLNPEQPL